MQDFSVSAQSATFQIALSNTMSCLVPARQQRAFLAYLYALSTAVMYHVLSPSIITGKYSGLNANIIS